MHGKCNICGRILDIKNLRYCGSKIKMLDEKYSVSGDPIYECKYCICESIRDEFDHQGSDIKLVV